MGGVVITLMIPELPQMTPLARQNMALLMATFAATRDLDGDFPATLAAVDDPRPKLVVLDYGPDADQRAQCTAVAALWLHTAFRPDEVLWLSDTFLRDRRDDPLPVEEVEREPSPGDDPRAMEALATSYATRQGTWTTMIPYHRDDAGRLTWDRGLPWKPVDPTRRDGFGPSPMMAAIATAVGAGIEVPAEIAHAIANTPIHELNAMGIHPHVEPS